MKHIIHANIRRIRKNKLSLSLIVTICVAASLLGGTYAWYTSTDSKDNLFKGGSLAAEISEVFTPNDKWQPGEQTTKSVRVQNTGKTKGFIRLSLYEYLLAFQLDMSPQNGHGNLKTVSLEHSPVVDSNDPDTWAEAAGNQGTYSVGGDTYLVADTAIVPNVLAGTDMYKPSTDRTGNGLTNITLNFAENVFTTMPATSTVPFWLYQNGYFYYSELLEPGAFTDPLLDNVTLSENVSNAYKGALYKLRVLMDGHDATVSVFDEWNIQAGSSLFELYNEQLLVE